MTPTTGAGWEHSSGVGGREAAAAADSEPVVGVCAATTPDCTAPCLGRRLRRGTTLPQFLAHAGTPTVDALLLAYTHAVHGVTWVMALVTFLHRVGPWIQRRQVRRTLDAVTGAALIGFASTLAAESR